MVQGTKLYVGNLSWKTSDDSLRAFFASTGDVTSASVALERDTGRSRGFGFVEMATPEAAQAAIDALNEQELDGRKVFVSEARPREDRPARY
ncbi:MAG: RNA-binding protein [Candidatus Gracilibacteria bacterium]